MQVDQGKKRTTSKRAAAEDHSDGSEDERMGDETEMLDVSFSFFDPQPQDYHSIKLLLSQLFQGDSSVLDLGGVTDLVLEQKLVGSTVKTDSDTGDDQASQGDPYAVLTVLNLNVHQDKPCISQLTKYLASKSTPSSALHTQLSQLSGSSQATSTASKPRHVGLVLNERLVNMPVQVVPPMFRMLEEELQWALDDNEPYHFSHYVFLSRVFNSSNASFEEDPNAALQQSQATTNPSDPSSASNTTTKKKKKQKAQHDSNPDQEQTFFYHAEDEWIQQFATEKQVFKYTNTKRSADSSEQDQFGVDARGQLMLVPANKFGQVVQGMEPYIASIV
ncbi:protein-transporting protein BCP1 [Sporobolomyces koalae]|uniref:protein-transporting protein BCP1 n=1 Tax=Sporobolomyces koalae TaxID=500713 RepID=UPI00317442DF